jgi:hypothetical protein
VFYEDSGEEQVEPSDTHFDADGNIAEHHGPDEYEDAETYAVTLAENARRSFAEAQKLLAEIKQARGYFPVVGIWALPYNQPPRASGS